jgi:hypothetical protein
MDMQEYERFFEDAAGQARLALCARARCGAVVVRDAQIIGRGYNAPPRDDMSQRMCHLALTSSPKPKADRTCCVHAEWRAILDALRRTGNLSGGTLYFTRVNKDGALLRSGRPYCTACSRLALDSGLSHFALWHDDGIVLYDAVEYNRLSYRSHLDA